MKIARGRMTNAESLRLFLRKEQDAILGSIPQAIWDNIGGYMALN
jgi:hypothetical protein